MFRHLVFGLSSFFPVFAWKTLLSGGLWLSAVHCVMFLGFVGEARVRSCGLHHKVGVLGLSEHLVF